MYHIISIGKVGISVISGSSHLQVNDRSGNRPTRKIGAVMWSILGLQLHGALNGPCWQVDRIREEPKRKRQGPRGKCKSRTEPARTAASLNQQIQPPQLAHKSSPGVNRGLADPNSLRPRSKTEQRHSGTMVKAMAKIRSQGLPKTLKSKLCGCQLTYSKLQYAGQAYRLPQFISHQRYFKPAAEPINFLPQDLHIISQNERTVGHSEGCYFRHRSSP